MHGKQKRFHAPFYVGKRRIMEQTEKQTTDKEQGPHIKKKIGRTTYNVAIHFSKTSRETMTDKINRLILHDINSEDFS